MTTIWSHRRILDTLDFIMAQHRLVVCPSVIKKDYDSTNTIPTRDCFEIPIILSDKQITKGANTLSHDDRIDVADVLLLLDTTTTKDQD